MISPSVTQNIEYWPIERLVEYPPNPRKNDSAVDRMCASIREFGFKIPCLVRSDGEVVDGHLRLKAARKLGMTEIPVLLCDEWSPAAGQGVPTEGKSVGGMGGVGFGTARSRTPRDQEADFDLRLTGFEDEELARLLAAQDAADGLTDEDAVPDVSETPRHGAGRTVAAGQRSQAARRGCHGCRLM